jgi:hypothetical protein
MQVTACCLFAAALVFHADGCCQIGIAARIDKNVGG